jgi:DNA-binding MarR family transcriptional regulator
VTPTRSAVEELARQLGSLGAVRRELARRLPPDCPAGSAGVLTALRKHGEMRMSRLTELLGIDLSVTSRHVAHAAERGWIERHPDPHDGRSRLLRLSRSGEERLAELSRRAADTLQEHLADWPQEDVTALTALLERLHTSFEDGRPAAAPPAPRTAAVTV